MANIAKEKLNEIEKLAKASVRKVDALTKDIEKIDIQIKKLNDKKKSLTNAIVSERNATFELDKLANQMENIDENMAELLYLGFATKYGLPTTNIVTVKKNVKQKAANVYYLDGYKPWAKEISVACKGYRQNAVMNKVYAYLRKNYGIVFEQEEKEFFKANGRMPKKTKELMFWIERTKPVHKGLTLSCTNTIVSEYNDK